MSKGDRNGDIARGIIIGLVLSSVLFIALGAIPLSVNIMAQSAADCGANPNDCKQSGKWTLWGLTFDFEDTIAQWMMMSFTVIASIVLIRTLVATQDMAANTKSIGKEQIAASIAAVNAARDANAVATAQLRNAARPWISVELSGPCWDGPSEMFANSDAATRGPAFLKAPLYVENISAAPAIIRDFRCDIVENPDFKILDVARDSSTKELDGDDYYLLKSGADATLCPRLGVSSGLPHQPFVAVQITKNNFTFFKSTPFEFSGWVRYSDFSGNVYTSYFRFSGTSREIGNWRRVGGAKYNYDEEN